MTSALTPDQRAWLQAELERRRAELSGQLADHLHGQTRAERAADVASQDADDAPQRAPERDIAQALTELEQRELEAVTAALQRLQDGHCGRCIECGDDIPFDRLQAKPWAMRCVACATRLEQRSR